MAFEVANAPPQTYDRSAANPNWSGVVMPESTFVDGATFNELQSMERRRNRRVGNMTAHDGDRIAGCDIVVDPSTGNVTLAAGQVYVVGDVLPVASATFNAVPMTGNARIGVRLQTSMITSDDDASLVGLGPGTWAEGEPVGARQVDTLVWALDTDSPPGDFYQVYLIVDGTVVDQAPPSALSGVLAEIAANDYGVSGSYVVSGCEVTALGNLGDGQVYSIAAGEANILGFKKIRYAALRLTVAEAFDLEAVAAEPSTWTGPDGGQTIVTVQRPPIQAVSSAIVVKRITQTVTRGVVPGGTDALQFSSVVSIVSITQGATTFVSGTDFTLAGGQVSWAPTGGEPAASSTYSVTYLYNVQVTPDEVTATTVKLTGGVAGQPILISYTSKLPRIDLVCLDRNGLPSYVKGLSGRQNLLAPPEPYGLLKLAEISNTWIGIPVATNNGTRRTDQPTMTRYFNLLLAIAAEMDRQVQMSKIAASSPVAKKGIFTDPFADDSYRDAGEAQTAAVNQGTLGLAIDLVGITTVGTDIVTLPYIEEIVVSQDIATSGMKINPYANFVSMPADLKLEPGVDYWTEEQTVYTSPVTQEFVAAPGQPPGTQTFTTVVSASQVAAQFLRPISVAWTVSGFAVGENLATLTFDGVDVKPTGTQTADAHGIITGTFTIPANIPAGTKTIRAEGSAGSFASALFVGQGTIDVTTARIVTLISRTAPPPVTVVNNVTNVTNVTNVSTTVVSTPKTNINLDSSDQSQRGHNDPLAESFAVPEARQIIGANFKFTAIGDRSNGVRLQLSTMDNGNPTQEVMAEAFINMQVPAVGDTVQPRFGAPVYLADSDLFCNVILTDDANHAVAVAKLGEIDPTTGQKVSSQPYTVGDLFSSSNRASWLVMPDTDLTFAIVAAKYTATTKTVDLWTGALDHVSDITVRGTVDIPNADASFHYEIVRASGDVISLLPGQTWSFDEFVTEIVTLRAVLEGTDKVGPILFPGTQLICGRIRTAGTYVSKTWISGNPVTVNANFAAYLPAGSSVTVDVDNADDAWASLTAGTTDQLGDGWTEPSFSKASFTGTQGRLRLTLNGGPAGRPSLAGLRAFTF